MTPKFAIVLPIGAADEPRPELGGRTPLEAADTHCLDTLVSVGRLGTVQTVPDDFPSGQDAALTALLGYDVTRCFTGRGPLEAVGLGLSLAPEEVAFRCNLVTVDDGRLTDCRGGRIRTAEAEAIVATLNSAFAEQGVRFAAGRSYRGLMIVRDAAMLDVACIPPHEIVGESTEGYAPQGRGAKRLRDIIAAADAIVARHEVNLVRHDLGETPANAVWPWGQGVVPILQRFRQVHGIRGAAIGAADMMRGLAKLVGWPFIEPPGATGDVDTDYAAKGRAAAAALDEFDLVVVHVDAASEASHAGDVQGKVRALRRIDREIVEPIIERLQTFEAWRLMVATDGRPAAGHDGAVCCVSPFCMAGSSVPQGVAQQHFSERLAAESDLHVACGPDLMEYFLRL